MTAEAGTARPHAFEKLAGFRALKRVLEARRKAHRGNLRGARISPTLRHQIADVLKHIARRERGAAMRVLHLTTHTYYFPEVRAALKLDKKRAPGMRPVHVGPVHRGRLPAAPGLGNGAVLHVTTPSGYEIEGPPHMVAELLKTLGR